MASRQNYAVVISYYAGDKPMTVTRNTYASSPEEASAKMRSNIASGYLRYGPVTVEDCYEI